MCVFTFTIQEVACLKYRVQIVDCVSVCLQVFFISGTLPQKLQPQTEPNKWFKDDSEEIEKNARDKIEGVFVLMSTQVPLLRVKNLRGTLHRWVVRMPLPLVRFYVNLNLKWTKPTKHSMAPPKWKSTRFLIVRTSLTLSWTNLL